jgi:integrase
MAQIRKRGPSQYQARVRLTGHPEVSRTFSSRLDALAWAGECERLVSQGLGDALREADQLTLYHALERYANEVTPAKRSQQQELSRLRRWQQHPLADQCLSRIRAADFAKFRDLRQEQGVGPNTVRLDLALVSHVFEVARKDWGLEALSNPVKAIRKPKLPRGRERRLHAGEEAQLLAYCDAQENILLRAFIVLAIETAMRRGEIANLSWADVNLNSRMAYLHETKNGTSRVVPLSTRAVAALSTLPQEPQGRLVTIHRDNISGSFASACEACGIDGLTLHDLRHEATSRLFEKGFNMMEVSTITGHKSLSMLKRYTHLRPADLLDRLG